MVGGVVKTRRETTERQDRPSSGEGFVFGGGGERRQVAGPAPLHSMHYSAGDSAMEPGRH